MPVRKGERLHAFPGEEKRLKILKHLEIKGVYSPHHQLFEYLVEGVGNNDFRVYRVEPSTKHSKEINCGKITLELDYPAFSDPEYVFKPYTTYPPHAYRKFHGNFILEPTDRYARYLINVPADMKSLMISAIKPSLPLDPAQWREYDDYIYRSEDTMFYIPNQQIGSRLFISISSGFPLDGKKDLEDKTVVKYFGEEDPILDEIYSFVVKEDDSQFMEKVLSLA